MAAAAAVFLHLVFFRAGAFVFPFPTGSNGVFFDEAQRLLSGQVMYRDFFEFVGPGTAHLDALVLALGGPRIAALGWAAVALGTALALLVHELASALAPRPWRLLAPAAFLSLVYAPYTFGDHKWPALCVGWTGLAVLGRGPQGTPAHLAAGVLLGAATLFTQDLGLGLIAGSIAFLLWQGAPARHLAAVCAGAVLAPALALLFFAWKAGLGTVVYAWLLFPLTRYRELNPFRLTASFTARTLPRDVAQLVLAAAGVMCAVAELRRTRDERRPVVALLALAGLGAFAATAHRGWYPMGLAVQSATLIPMVARRLALRLADGRWRSAPMEAAVLLVLAAGIVHGSAGFVAWRQLLQPMVLEQRRAGPIWTSRPMPELAWIEGRTRAGDPVFLLPARGGHYFLTRTRDVTSFPYLIEGQHTPEQARTALAQIEAARPAVGIWDQRPWPRSEPGSVGPLDLLYAGLLKSYRAERLPNGVLLLTRIGP